MFIRNETFSSYIRKFPIVSGIIALTVFIHFILLLLPSGLYFRYLGIGLNSGIEAGEYWRLVTPIFLHGDLFHLIFNMGALLIFAPALEGMLGRFKFALIYLIPGILANVATFFSGRFHILTCRRFWINLWAVWRIFIYVPLPERLNGPAISASLFANSHHITHYDLY